MLLLKYKIFVWAFLVIGLGGYTHCSISYKYLQPPKDTASIFNKKELESFTENTALFKKATVLMLINLDLGKIPDSIIELKDIRKIELVGNKIKELPEYLSKFPYLEEFSIGYNPDLDLRLAINVLAKCKNLRVLRLYRNDISELPAEISELTQISVLDLQLNRLKTVTEPFQYLRNLEELTLDSNPVNLDSISHIFKNMKNLKKLSFYNCNISKFPENIEDWINIEELRLEVNHIKKIPDNISKLERLQALIMPANEIDEISESILLLKNLRLLVIGTKISNREIISLRKKMPWCNIIN